MGGGAVPDPLLGLHGEALPRASAGRAWLRVELHLDERGAAEPRAGAPGAAAFGAPQEAGAPAAAGDDVVPGRLDPCLLAGQAPCDLIVTLDDATSEIYSGFLVEEEGTFSSFRGLAETIASKELL